ncbi:hypothetical protein K3495_g13055 [Podosphaera aphanis]|nr:hypothetical protein K3495_g13055 [Podosphaera aphanis]
MCKIDGLMDQHLYTEILEEDLLQTLVEYGKTPESVIFMQDNDPKHTSKKARQFLRDHSLAVLPWPANSPDLNPIEHLWNYIKKRLKDYPKPPNGILELLDRVQDEWAKIPAEECQKLMESLPRRIDAVLKAKGGHVKY